MRNKFLKVCVAVLSAMLCVTGVACGKNADAGFNWKTKTYMGAVKVGTNEVKVYSTGNENNYKTVSFEETNALCEDNEGQGWVVLEEPLYGGLPSLGYKGTLPEVKAVSLSTGWSVIEQTPGVYDWREMDKTIEYWVSQGKTINMRLCTDGLTLNQGVIHGCPAWIFEEPYNVPQVVNDGQIYADLSSKVYQTELKKFLAVFAEHYTNENYPYRDAIEVVELRGYGMVGEWHSGWNTYSSVEERTETLCSIIDMWREAWGDKLLVLSCTYEFLQNMHGVIDAQSYSDFMYYMGYDHALTLDNITFRRDGIAFALQKYDMRMANDYFYMNTGLPLFGEIGDGYYKHGDDAAYPLFESLNEALHKWRVNYNTVIGWVAQDFGVVIEKETAMVEYFNRYMGYRLVPDKVGYSSKVKSGDKFYLDALFTNKAMGRCWTDYDLSIYFEDENGNTVYSQANKNFKPIAINGGEPRMFNLSYDLPADLKGGKYTVKMAITDADGKPAIEMPVSGGDGNKKYYVGEVTVGNTAAERAIKIDEISEATSFKAVGSGMLTSRLVNVDGSKAIVGGGDGVFARGQKLENGKTYYVTFEYKTDKDKKDINIEDDSAYIAGAVTENGEWGDGYEWLDVSNMVAGRTVTVKVPSDGKTYHLGFGAKNGAAKIAIDNVSAVKADALDLEINVNTRYTTKNDDGSYEMLSRLNIKWADGIQIANKLDAHSTYMLTFDAATTSEISGGGFFYARMSVPNEDMTDKYGAVENFTENRIGSFYTPVDKGYRKYSYVFNTGDYADGSSIMLGVRNLGGVSIKNLSLTRLATDYSYDSDNVKIKHNVVPDKGINVDENGIVENFEASVFNGGCMFPGDRTTGIISDKEKYLISGKYSCYIENTNPLSPAYEFNVFCRTNTADFYFSANTTYRVRFKFKVIDDVKASENGQFYCLAREEGTFLHDKGVFEWKSGYETGKVYSVEYEFTTGDSDKYYFMWGVHYYGSIAIDDVTFDKVEPSGKTTPVVTEGHAYQITQDVLYKH